MAQQPRVWVVTAKEFGGAEEVVHDGHRLLVFADTAEGYSGALGAFTAVVRDRLGAGRALFSYPGDIGQMARAHIVVQDSREMCDKYGYSGDTYQLQPYAVQEG
jgi:hypothetical protein